LTNEYALSASFNISLKDEIGEIAGARHKLILRKFDKRLNAISD